MISVNFTAARTQASIAATRLRLPLRSRTWRGQAGEFTGSGTGSSLDFQDHRSYMAGDDPRHINWQAYARTGQYTMKLFREEVRPIVDLIFDVSESLFFEENKARRTAELLYFIADSCATAGASLHIQMLRGDFCQTLDAAGLTAHRWLDSIRALPATAVSAPPDISKTRVRSGSIRVLLSDLLFPGAPEEMLRYLAQRHGTIIVFAPFLADEANPDWSGNYEFIDAETGIRHPHRIEPAVLRNYLAAYTNHFALWKQAAVRHSAALARIPAAGDLSTALFHHALPVKALETIHV